MKEAPKSYPLEMCAPETVARGLVDLSMKELIECPVFDGFDRDEVFRYAQLHLDDSIEHFSLEENARKNRIEGANLFYHEKPHAVYQTTYDAVMLGIALLQKSHLSRLVTPDGMFATLSSPHKHDVGYVIGVNLGENFAARTPIHVKESMRVFGEAIDKIGVPRGIDPEKVKLLGGLAIHKTNFPYTPEHEAEARSVFNQMGSELRTEAQIIRALMQFADLGGQCARVDYFPQGVINLREEMNAAYGGLGTKIIGENHELREKAAGFMSVVNRMVGRTGKLIFGNEIKPYSDRWNAIKG